MASKAHDLARALVCGFLATACVAPDEVTALGVPGRMHLSYAAGWKHKQGRWSPGEDETLLGFVDFDRRLEVIPAWFVGKILVGTGDVPSFVTDPDADSAGTAEFCIGLRKYGSLGRAEPFASAGIALLTAGITGYHEETSNAFSVASELAAGAWVDAGVQVPVTASLVLGLAVHQSVGTEAELEGTEIRIGGTSLLFTLGLRR